MSKSPASRRNHPIHCSPLAGVEQGRSSEDSFESEELTSDKEADREGVGGGVGEEGVGVGVEGDCVGAGEEGYSEEAREEGALEEGDSVGVGAGRIGGECKAQGRDGVARGSFCR